MQKYRVAPCSSSQLQLSVRAPLSLPVKRMPHSGRKCNCKEFHFIVGVSWAGATLEYEDQTDVTFSSRVVVLHKMSMLR